MLTPRKRDKALHTVEVQTNLHAFSLNLSKQAISRSRQFDYTQYQNRISRHWALLEFPRFCTDLSIQKQNTIQNSKMMYDTIYLTAIG